VAGEAGFDQVPHDPPELGVGGFFGPLHKSGIADHIGGEDGRQPPLNPLLSLSHGASELFEWDYTSMVMRTRERN
jgi:hypothetical protein